MSRRSALFGGANPLAVPRQTLILLGALGVLLVVCIIASRVSQVAFIGIGLALLALLAMLSWRSPRLVLIAMALMPIFDRYVISLLIPQSLVATTNFFSEGLLLLVALVVTARAVRDGTLVSGLRHPMLPLMAGFLVVAALSAVANGVPPLIALAGTIFTVDAVVLFFLPRLVGFEPRQAAIAAATFVTIAGIAALLAVSQIALAPTIFGMEVSQGRFSEGHRVTAFFDGNPNMLGAVLAMATPFPAFAARHLPGRWRIGAWALVAILALALFYTFSRGAWLGLAISMLTVGLIINWRALALVMAAGLLAYGAAHVMPRNLLSGLFAGEGGQQVPEVELDLGDATFGRVDSIGQGRDLRFLFIQNAVPIIADHPVIGAGPGRYGGAVSARFPTSPLYDRYTEGAVPEGRTVDNFWLHLVVEMGILGSLLFAAGVAFVIFELVWHARRAVGMVQALMAAFAAMGMVLAVDSLTEMLLEGNTTSFSMWFFLGVGSSLVLWERRRRAEAEAIPATPGEPAG